MKQYVLPKFKVDVKPEKSFYMPGDVVTQIDFGQAARLGEASRRLLGELIMAIVDNDPSRMVHAFAAEDMLQDHVDVRKLSDDVEDLLEVYHDLPLNEIPFGKLMGQTFDLIRRHHVRPPSEFTLMLKSMITIESVSMSLSGNFKLLEYLKPYARRLDLEQLDPRKLIRRTRRSLRDLGELAAKLPVDFGAVLSKFKRGDFQFHIQHEHLDKMVETLDRGSNRVSFALIIAGLLVGSSMLVPQSGMVLNVVRLQTLGVMGYVIAAVLGLWLLHGIIRSGKV